MGAREDAWSLPDFGREVVVDEMALTLRADFPHNAYWVSGHVVMSDGSEIALLCSQYPTQSHHQIASPRSRCPY